MSDTYNRGGLAGDPAPTLTVAGTNGCCAAEAKAEAVASGAGCCG